MSKDLQSLITKQVDSLKRILLSILVFLIFQGSKAQTVLNPGDMAIIGINYDVVPYELTIVNFVPISAGTTIRITDYGYDSGTGAFAAVSLTNTAEGSIAWTTTSSITANTVIKMAITVSTGPSVTGLPGTVVLSGWTNTAPGTCPSAAGGDNWFIFQGPNATTVSNWVFGWANPFATTHNSVPQVAGQFLQPGSGAPNNGNSYLPAGLTLGSTAVALNYDISLGGYHGDNNVYTGMKCGSQSAVLSAICSQANWLTNETTTYNIDPGGTYFPGANPIFCVTAPCPTPTLSFIAKNNVLCNGGSNGTATMSATGGGPFTYTWSPSGGNSNVATGLSAGNYTCVCTNSCGSTASNTVTITQPSAISTSTAVTNVLCFGNSTGSASVTASGGAGGYTYVWSTAATSSVISSQNAGVKTVTVTDANGCTRTATVAINQPASALNTATAITNVLCNGGSNGSATVTASGGTGAYTYLWNTAATASIITGQNAGVKTVTVTDANSCTSTNSVTITQPSAITTATANANVSCFGGSNGSATVTASGGTGAYTYLWSTGATSSVITGQPSGVKTVTVTDGNGCTSTKSVNISQPVSALTSATAVTNVSCNGGSNGTATVTASGGTGAYTYLWSTSATTSVITGQIAGVKTVTVTDANICTSVASVLITQPSALITSTAVTNVTCFGGSNGSATITASGGTGAYTYLWSSAQTTSVVSGLNSGIRTVTVTDASGCTSVKSVNIGQPVSALTASQSQNDITCLNPNGSASVNASGGTGSYTYSWAPAGGTSSVSTVLSPGNYTCTITDANSCSITSTFAILSNTTAPSVSITGTFQVCNGQSTVLTASGANTYSWSTSAITNTVLVSPTVPTTYSVTGTNTINGCSTVATHTLIVNSIPTITVNSGAICLGNSFTITPSGASTYTIQGGNAVVSPTTSTSYSVVGTSSAGCVSANTATSNITVNPLPSVTANSFSVTCDGNTGCLSSSGATNYSWAGPCGFSSALQSPCFPFNIACACTYTVFGTDGNGCTNSATVCLNINPNPTVTASTSNTLLCAGQTATLTANGAVSYVWNPGGPGINISVSPTVSTTYTVTGLDAAGCSNTVALTQSVSACTGLNEHEIVSGVSVYPNPNNGIFEVSIQNADKNTTVTVLNVVGQTILNTTVVEEKTVLNLQESENGIYFIVISNSSIRHIMKIIKE